MKKYFTILASALLIVLAVAACKSKGGSADDGQAATEQVEQNDSTAMETKPSIDSLLAALPAEPVFVIETSLGDIKIKLFSDTPKHRENFARLALSGFYDGLLFHRVINGFMIQGGDPLTKDPANKAYFGTGGPDYTVPAEILPEHTHLKGALAAARRGDAANPKRESSGSQFYIVQDPVNCAQLDGQYTVYGQTVEGIEVIDKIAKVQTDGRDCPVNDVKIISVKLAE